MATNRGNKLLENFKGMLGDFYYMIRGGEQIMLRRPNRSNHKKKPREAETQDSFTRANIYARKVNKDPVAKAFYTPFRQPKLTEYLLAQSDCMVPPQIHSCDTGAYTGLGGQPIYVVATDNIKVVEVKCSILGADGKDLESGRAVPGTKPDEWIYSGQLDHLSLAGYRIRIQAYDRPRNEARMELPLDESATPQPDPTT